MDKVWEKKEEKSRDFRSYIQTASPHLGSKVCSAGSEVTLVLLPDELHHEFTSLLQKNKKQNKKIKFYIIMRCKFETIIKKNFFGGVKVSESAAASDHVWVSNGRTCTLCGSPVILRGLSAPVGMGSS